MSRQQADAGGVGWVPAKREQMAAKQGAHRKGDGKVEDDGEPRREGAIVDAGAMLYGDRHFADYLPGWRDDDVADSIPDTAVVATAWCSPVSGSRCGCPENEPPSVPSNGL